MIKTQIVFKTNHDNEFKHSILSAYQYQLNRLKKAEDAYSQAFESTTSSCKDKAALHRGMESIQSIMGNVYSELAEAARMRIEVYDLIKTVKPVNLSLLLQLIYIEGLNYEEAAEKLQICEFQIADMHSQALSVVNV